MKILFLDNGLELENDELFEALEKTFPEVERVTVQASHLESLENVDYWNSLLVYRFISSDIDLKTETYISKFKEVTKNKGTIFPIAYGDEPIPPEPIKYLKANSIKATNALNIIVNRIGAFLGLTCLGKDHTIFISHRAKDGRVLAEEIEKILLARGFHVWRDEAKDKDQEGPIIIGEDAQATIQSNLEKCSVILLVDTPLVTESDWVKKEIDMANAQLIPILPICFRPHDDGGNGPRFKVLRDLYRWLDVKGNNATDDIADNLSEFLLDIYNRKRTMPGIMENAFKKRGYSWTEIDPKKLYFSSAKKLKYLLTNNILSHCPIHKGLYPPYVHLFSQYTPAHAQHFNRRILVYEGEVVHQSEIQDLIVKNGAHNVDILHHQEIELALEYL